MWIIYAILAAAVWGLDYAVGEKLIKKISTTSLLLIDMFVGVFFFFIVGYRSHLKKDLALIFSDPHTLRLTLAAITTFSLGNWLVLLSIHAKNATVTGLIEICYPLFTAVFAYFLFKENQLTFPVLFGGAMIICGIVIISVFG
jgi:drug/metabolite transporter (DMT)-like permease